MYVAKNKFYLFSYVHTWWVNPLAEELFKLILILRQPTVPPGNISVVQGLSAKKVSLYTIFRENDQIKEVFPVIGFMLATLILILYSWAYQRISIGVSFSILTHSFF